MKKIKEKWNQIWKKKNEKYFVSFGLIGFSLILCVTLYRVCLQRLITGIKDCGSSFVYYFSFITGNGRKVIEPTVNHLPNVSIGDFLPFDLLEVQRKLGIFWSVFFDGDTFLGYLSFLLESLSKVIIFGSLIVPTVFLLGYLLVNQYTEQHIEVKQRKGRMNRFFSSVMIAIKASWDYIQKYIEFLKKHKGILGVLIVLWLINVNVMTIGFETIAWYFYWVSSFDFASIGTQLVKLTYDLIIMLWTLPGILWVVIGYKIFDVIRMKFAFEKLNHLESKNRGFDNSLPVATMICGTLAAGKTKTAVDIALSDQNEFRDRSLEMLDRNMMRFPNFNFMAYEASLKEAIAKEEIKNLYTARRYIRQKRFQFGRRPAPENIWGYDFRKYKKSYNNGLELIGVWKCLEFYAQEYFIYTMTTCLIISNIAIRSDLDPVDKGFFLSFNMDFFKRDPAKVKEYSAYSHIIDFDLFRIGCQMNKKNSIAGSFEFGVIVVSEIGKERQNTLELKEVKKNSTEANQKNDLFNAWLMTCRHAATVEGYSFIRFVCDDQRPTSWGAAARDICAVLNIKKTSDRRLTLRFCILPDFYMLVLIPKYFKWYNKVKKYGNENSPMVKNIHRVMGWLYAACERKLNVFSYYKETILREDGTLEGEGEECKYYLMPKKIYAGRYSTDCYKELFSNRVSEAGTSFYTIDTYKTACAMLEELKRQNSYFANDFIKMYQGVSE